MVIGDNVKIQNNVSVYTGVMLEDDVFCGPSMVFTNVDQPAQPRVAEGRVPADAGEARRHPRRERARSSAATRSGGTRSSAPARSSRSDVPDYALVVGNPGRIVGWMCECGVKIGDSAAVPLNPVCSACGARYVAGGESLTRTGPRR